MLAAAGAGALATFSALSLSFSLCLLRLFSSLIYQRGYLVSQIEFDTSSTHVLLIISPVTSSFNSLASLPSACGSAMLSLKVEYDAEWDALESVESLLLAEGLNESSELEIAR